MKPDDMTRIASLVFLAVMILPASAGAQTLGGPISNVTLAGYGSASYSANPNSDFRNDFTASVSPILLYSMGEDLLFETELEFGLSGELTTTTLEYAQIDYLGFERFIISAGKFLLPFGTFSERLHPTWINKLPTAPLLYGHGHGGVAEGSLLPVLSDVGLLVRYKAPVGKKWAFDASGWISQGPRLVGAGEGGDGHGDAESEKSAHKASFGIDEEGHPASEIDIPAVGFGVSFSDNNSNKMLGVRLGLVYGPSFEVYVSGFHSMVDPDNFLDMTGFNISAEWRKAGLEIRGEAILLNQELKVGEGFDTLSSTGYYVQVAKRYGLYEPVIRWSHLLESSLEDQVARPERRQLAVGLSYWIEPSIPVKVAYQVDFDGDDLLLIQWAFGF